MPPNKNNPYAKAAGAYDQNAQKNTPDQRELEGRVLLKSARMIQDLQNNWDNADKEILEATLKYNRQIWMLFYDTALENPEGSRPNDLRSNIINLANFIFKREMEILSDPQKEKLNVLVNINKEVAAGLLVNQKSGEAQQTATPTDAQVSESSGNTDIQG